MKFSILAAGVCILSFAACTNENKTSGVTDTSEVIAVDTTFTATNVKKNSSDCYAYIKNRDTATLQINIEGEELTGDLNYRLFEKDSNKGKIAGEMRGDTVIAEYTFDSEGMRSVREVIFVRKADGALYEGTGEVMEKGGKTIFKNRSALKFNSGLIFKPTDCEQLK